MKQLNNSNHAIEMLAHEIAQLNILIQENPSNKDMLLIDRLTAIKAIEIIRENGDEFPHVTVGLTLDALKAMQPDTVIARGFYFHSSIFLYAPFWWCAVRRNIEDWAIYYRQASIIMGDYRQASAAIRDKAQEILSEGQKLMHPPLVRELVPCTDSAFSKYAY